MDHVRAIGVCNLVVATLFLAGGPILFTTRLGDRLPWILIVYVAATGLVALMAGIGLVGGKSWGRVPALVSGVLLLVSIPFGTALGIYTIVQLRKPAVRAKLG